MGRIQKIRRITTQSYLFFGGLRMDLNKFEGVTVEDGYLIVKVKANPNPERSKSGKSLINYSTHGNITLPDGSKVGINWYR